MHLTLDAPTISGNEPVKRVEQSTSMPQAFAIFAVLRAWQFSRLGHCARVIADSDRPLFHRYRRQDRPRLSLISITGLPPRQRSSVCVFNGFWASPPHQADTLLNSRARESLNYPIALEGMRPRPETLSSFERNRSSSLTQFEVFYQITNGGQPQQAYSLSRLERRCPSRSPFE